MGLGLDNTLTYMRSIRTSLPPLRNLYSASFKIFGCCESSKEILLKASLKTHVIEEMGYFAKLSVVDYLLLDQGSNWYLATPSSRSCAWLITFSLIT